MLGDVLELQLEEPHLLRIAAHRLRQIGEVDLAIDLFEKVLRMRPEDRSLRDSPWLSKPGPMTDEEAGRAGPAITLDYVRSVELLSRSSSGVGRPFPESGHRAGGGEPHHGAGRAGSAFGHAVFPVDARLRKLLDADLRIVMTWDTDLTDMDL